MPKQWFPLESNPIVMTKYVAGLGVDMSAFQFHDVLSTEEWAIDMIPQPVLGVLMLFPVKEVSEVARREESQRITEKGQILSPKCFYMKQTVGNACGTVGLLHCMMNCKEYLSIEPQSYLDKFIAATQNMTPEERAEYLSNDEEIEVTHESAASEGQSAAPSNVTEVDTHFICFTNVDGHLYELDGRKSFPINHGVTSQNTLLPDACKIIQQFMDRDPAEMRFTIVALGGAALNDD